MKPLPPRERQVLELLYEGLTHRQIGAKLGIKPKTVSTYVDRLCARFECRGSILLVRAALFAGLLDLSEPVRNS